MNRNREVEMETPSWEAAWFSGISPPSFRNSPTSWAAFNCYAMNEEGYFDDDYEEDYDE